MHVQRFVIRAYPQDDHPKYYPWQAASIVLFVGESNRYKAEQLALDELSKRKWIPEKFLIRDTLIEDLVTAEGGEVRDAYKRAQKGEIFWLEDLEEIPFSTKQEISPMFGPRLSEEFVDKVIHDAGGHRLTTEEAGNFKEKNADYILEEFVVELKDLQEEGLGVATRQIKIANIFSKYPTEGPVQKIDPFNLSENDFREYLEIVGVPIKRRLRSALKQIKKTIERLSKEKYKGAIILLNTGYSTIPPDFLSFLGKKYTKKDTSSILEIITVSCWTITNGFDTWVNFDFSPHEPENKTIIKLKESFWKNIDILMTEWARNGFPTPQQFQQPMKPVSFRKNERVFTFGVPKIESTLKKPLK